MQHPDICIAGAGIIGLTLALELDRRGYRVTVFDQGPALAEASTAAAGMLAAGDPENPPLLRALADLSLSLYPGFLEYVQDLSNLRVPFQTHTTLQSLPAHLAATASELTAADLAHLLPALNPARHRFTLLSEHSIDPRQLATALLAAVHKSRETSETSIDLRLNHRVLSTQAVGDHIDIHTALGSLSAPKFIDCTGAWATSTSHFTGLPVSPKKGQMLAVALPSSFPLQVVVRTHDVYIVPRITGPNAGRAIIGATVEDAGFDKTLHSPDIASLRSLATALLPPLADAPQPEAWAGLRPATSDGLPLLGSLSDRPNHLLATGHYRNGILLAPATALVLAQLIAGETPSIDLAPFSPNRIPPKPA
jgi:glycine oxidase